MGFLIDTNVLSELRKPQQRINPNVAKWFAQINGEDVFISVLVIGEIRNGIERLRRRDVIAAARLEIWLLQIQTDLTKQILPVTLQIANRWGQLAVPDPLPVIDALLAATALEHDLILVTRNEQDMQKTGVRLFNPFL